MSEKSDDLMEAAIRAVDAVREDMLLAKASDNKALLRRVAISMVHGALLAERQRYADLVESFSPGGENYEYGHDDASMRIAIRDAILAPPSSTEES